MMIDISKTLEEQQKVRTANAKKLVLKLVTENYKKSVSHRMQEEIRLAQAKAGYEEAKRLSAEEGPCCGFGLATYDSDIQLSAKRLETWREQEREAEEAVQIVSERFIEESV